ncbi:transglycosylase domain-containing protein [Verrucomicrobiaceae bacterium N1E253]|uniref:peptidoglycan glycosyltransferase n=1 Tax=Oceaniferula marina TaxID=2748318 RepID=A0A851GQL5_9BACT|nr:transglycosylase domain-containing protein [Oceaniferula marina]NWK56464.1 transglycosylase domain-containing protein [Oceaniferula marina]
MAKKRSSTGNKRRKKRFFKLKWLLYLMILGLGAAGAGWVVFDVKTKPYRERAETYDLSKIDDVEVVSLILDRKGRELGRIFVENRDKISIKDVPEIMIQALISGEDQRFFEHDGVDRAGVIRAAYLNYKAGRQTQGASTITQQLARNAFHLKEESDKRGESGLERKAVEAFLALRIEERYGKYEILEFYLNRIPFGSGYYGIRSAALGYFGKEPRDLTASECASLVACIRNPTRISPLNDLEENKKNRDQVLGRMADDGYISSSKSKELQALPVEVNPQPIRRGASHLYDRIAGFVRGHLGEDAMTEGGFKIYTTIDLDAQRAMERGLKRQLDSVELKEGYKHPLYKDYKMGSGKPKYVQGAGLMIESRTGALIAYVGGRDFAHSQYDFIQSGKKPLGTAFLPFIYTAALENKMSLSNLVLDKPMDNRNVMLDGREGVLGEWGEESFTPSYEGDITLRHAMEVSKIAASIRLGKKLGLDKVANTARRFGLMIPNSDLLARMLVGTDDVSLPELVRAYAVFPNGGVTPQQVYAIDKIEDASGVVRYTAEKPTAPKRVITAQNAFLMHSMLQSSLRKGTGADGIKTLKPDPSTAGKTGTTYDFADNWFVGYNSRVTCAVWSGFLDGGRDEIYPAAFSRETVLPVWIDAMNAADSEFPGTLIPAPEGIVKLEICKDSGRRKTRYCQNYIRNVRTGEESYTSTAYTEYFVKGRAPSGFCEVHGVSDPSLAKTTDFGGGNQQNMTTHAIPVQPQAPVLLGVDPYGTEQPDFAPRDELAMRQARQTGASVNFDQLEDLDRAAAILLDKPGRVEIRED